MINMLNKKRVLLISLVGTIFSVSVFGLITLLDISFGGECDFGVYNPPIIPCTVGLSLYLLLFAVPVLIFSAVTLKMEEKVFLLWKKLTIIYLFIYLFIVAISPWIPSDFSPFSKKSNSFFLLCLYALISLILIAHKSFSSRKKR